MPSHPASSTPPTSPGPETDGKIDKWKTAVATLKLFARYGKPYLGMFAGAVVCLLVSGALGLAFPYYVGLLMDSAFTKRSTTSLNATLSFLFLILAIQAGFSFGRTYLLFYIGESFVADLRRDLYAHLLKLGLGFFADKRVGELTSRIASDVTLLQGSCTTNLAEGLRQFLILTGGMGVMLWTNTRLTLLTMVVLPALIVSAIFFGRKVRRVSTTVQDRLADATSVLEESLGGIRTVKSFAREEYELGRYAGFILQARAAAFKRALMQGAFNGFIVFVMFSGIVILLWYSGRQVLAGALTAGQLTSFLLYATIVGSALASFAGLYGEFNQTLGATRRVVELFETVPDIADGPQARHRVVGKVEFQDVGFAYPGREDIPVLRNISTVAEPGEVVALVGPSGAGKSTFISLIPRFYDVTAGAVRVDGLDLRQWRVNDLRQAVGIVPQETTLFAGTIEENLRYGKLDATRAEVEAAAQAANAHDFISAFPEGYATIVGERGVKLSGGQRQRIAIARAILKDPRILILDEATSSLDSESERLVQEALDELMRGRTTFVIAHRLSTVRRADRILVMNQGTIVETGTHAELIEVGGLYRRLHDLQFQDLPIEDVFKET